MLRFVLHSVPLLVALQALFSLVVGHFDLGPAEAVTVLDLGQTPLRLVLGAWLLEAFALVGLFLLVEGKTGSKTLDGLLAAWVAWTFRAPLLVVTIVAAAGRAQDPWWRLALGWWVLYTVSGLVMAFLTGRRDAAAKRRRVAAAEGL